jgi:hypothetical protein
MVAMMSKPAAASAANGVLAAHGTAAAAAGVMGSACWMTQMKLQWLMT